MLKSTQVRNLILSSFFILFAGTASAGSGAPKQIFLNTENIQTPQGAVYAEVQSFDIESEQDLKSAREQILGQNPEKLKAEEFFTLNIETTDREAKTNLDRSADQALAEISSAVSSNKKISQSVQVNTDPVKKSFFKRHYNKTLAVVRFMANATTVSLGLIVGKHISLEHAAMIGVLAGSMSAAIQLKSDMIFKWLSNSVLLVKAAKKIGLLSETDNGEITRSEHIIKEVEMYGRWASLEASFLAICQTSMALLNIPVTENLFATVAKSTASQGLFEVGVLKASKLLEQINPNWSEKSAQFKNISLFAGSGVSVLSAIGSMIDMPYANLGFITLSATGIVLNFSPKLAKLKPVEKIIEKWRPRPVILRCAQLF
ncbi:MAG: hypothetical protein ACXVAX_02905 [Pseudobdellovibrio sp.]